MGAVGTHGCGVYAWVRAEVPRQTEPTGKKAVTAQRSGVGR